MIDVIIRLATPDDAERVVAHARAIVAEPIETTPLAPDELRTIDETRLLMAVPVTLLAEVAGELLGLVTLRRPSPRRALQHAAVLGMSVRAASRRQGVGRALMTAILAWAGDNGVTRIELQVFARNAVAIALYEQFGFEREGVRRRSILLDGEYLDDVLMARLL